VGALRAEGRTGFIYGECKDGRTETASGYEKGAIGCFIEIGGEGGLERRSPRRKNICV